MLTGVGKTKKEFKQNNSFFNFSSIYLKKTYISDK